MTGIEDKKMTDDGKKGADGVLIFVSRHSTSDMSVCTNPLLKDLFILCRRRNIGRSLRAVSQADLSRHIRLSILPCKHL
jgi:hypothetical protein